MNPLYQQMKTSVFERMSLAAAAHGAVNLGQGFPDFGWSDEIPRLLKEDRAAADRASITIPRPRSGVDAWPHWDGRLATSGGLG